MSANKQAFAEISRALASDLPFSLKYEWWNEVVVDNWEVSIFKEKGDIKAVWPYFKRTKGPFKMLCQPAFTPYSGPIFNYPEGQKIERRYSFEQKAIAGVIASLPAFSELEINCRLDLNNTLPFIWEGFEDRKKYTYLLNLEQAEDEIWANFRENIRRQIRKAEKSLKIERSEDAELIDRMLRSTFSEQTSAYPIQDTKVYQRIVVFLKKHNCGELLVAKDDNNKVHACLLWIHDANSAYYLIGGADQEHKNSGAMSLLMWQAIRDSKSVSVSSSVSVSVNVEQGKKLKYFNFEGSMIPAIEKYLRGFGGVLTPYSCLYKNSSLGLKLARKVF